jgi:hypothetical protein
MNSTMYSALLATHSSLAAYERDGHLKSWCWPRKDAFHNHLRFFIFGLVQGEEAIWLDPERDGISFTWISPLERLEVQWHMHHPSVRGLRVRMVANLSDPHTLEHTYTIDAPEMSPLHNTKLWFLAAPEIAGRRSQFQCVRTNSESGVIRCDADPFFMTLKMATGEFRHAAAVQIDSHTSLGHLVQSFLNHPSSFRPIEMGRCAAVAVTPVLRWNSPVTVCMQLHAAGNDVVHAADTDIPALAANTPAGRSPSLSLRVLDALSSPSGAMLASAECDWEMRYSGGYGFVWPRDAAFVGLSLMECGLTDRALRLGLFLSKALGLSADFEQRYTDAAQPAPSWCLRQPDQRPLVCLLWIELLAANCMTDKQTLEIRTKLNVCLSAMADELIESPATALTGFDLWEEREGQHFFALVCAYGALVRGARFALTDTAQERCTRAAQDAAGLAQAHFSPLHKWPARTRNAGGQLDFTADASLLACLMPVPEFPLSAVRRSELFSSLSEALKHGIGFRRYCDDTYRGGGCWPLVGLWFGLSAGEVLPSGESAGYIRNTLRQASGASTSLGYLPEQIDPHSSQPSWVVPLAWSHAFFMQLSQRAEK